MREDYMRKEIAIVLEDMKKERQHKQKVKEILNDIFPTLMSPVLLFLGLVLAINLDNAFAISSEAGFIISFMCIYCIVEYNKEVK